MPQDDGRFCCAAGFYMARSHGCIGNRGQSSAYGRSGVNGILEGRRVSASAESLSQSKCSMRPVRFQLRTVDQSRSQISAILWMLHSCASRNAMVRFTFSAASSRVSWAIKSDYGSTWNVRVRLSVWYSSFALRLVPTSRVVDASDRIARTNEAPASAPRLRRPAWSD